MKARMWSLAKRRCQIATLTLVLVSVGLLAAACGGGSGSANVASLGSTTPTARAPSSPTVGNGGRTTANYRAALAYVDCMRSHGEVNMPDPTSDGQINVDFAHGGKDGTPASSGIDRTSPQYISADQSCRHLLPGGVPTPAQNLQALARGLKFAQCMRNHGVPNYPDPNPSDPEAVRLIGVDQNSPQFQGARKVCQALVPGNFGSK